MVSSFVAADSTGDASPTSGSSEQWWTPKKTMAEGDDSMAAPRMARWRVGKLHGSTVGAPEGSLKAGVAWRALPTSRSGDRCSGRAPGHGHDAGLLVAGATLSLHGDVRGDAVELPGMVTSGGDLQRLPATSQWQSLEQSSGNGGRRRGRLGGSSRAGGDEGGGRKRRGGVGKALGFLPRPRRLEALPVVVNPPPEAMGGGTERWSLATQGPCGEMRASRS